MAAADAQTILIVEDDFQIRAIMARELEQKGYTVLQAGQSDEALQISDSHAGSIDVLVTDVMLPNKMKIADKTGKLTVMNGVALMKRLTEKRPKMKTVLISGQSDTMIEALGVTKQGASFLKKPFNPETLARAVRDALGTPG
jgi:DNA-binding NtrC family response regulator